MTERRARIRIVLVDDHNLFRSGVKALLATQPDFEVVAEAADGLEGLRRVKELAPDVVLLDLHMPGMTGREAVRIIVEEHPATCVLMLTVSEDAEDLIQCLRSGARGYLLKNIDAEFFVAAIRRAAAGEAVVSPQLTAKLVAGVQAVAGETIPAHEDKDRLRPREREILALLAAGASNKAIARELNLAESTVKIHVQAILRKLHLSSRVQAAVYAVENGLAGRQ